MSTKNFFTNNHLLSVFHAMIEIKKGINIVNAEKIRCNHRATPCTRACTRKRWAQAEGTEETMYFSGFFLCVSVSPWWISAFYVFINNVSRETAAGAAPGTAFERCC